MGFSPCSLTGCVLVACYLATPVNSDECPAYSYNGDKYYHYCSKVCCDYSTSACCEWVNKGLSRGAITGIVFGSMVGLVVLFIILGAIGTCITKICSACQTACKTTNTSTRQATVHPGNEISTVSHGNVQDTHVEILSQPAVEFVAETTSG